MPAGLWIVYRMDQVAAEFFSAPDTVLRGAIYVYIVLFVFFIFRAIVVGFRWTFPVVEIQGARSAAVRRSMSIVLSSVLLALCYDVLKTLTWA
ncbi:hypothetical protein B1C78_15685 [Thioalkalivibrio denitrificans]|uniref:Uncharacterized protein n=1 Tax=Thioalkalivibrio denitrificans TaxID=108003 RepID=A0A1V3NAK4_9GAMM|nr:hypothetical protein B1C78_15685 [Thioalkalivibrio denitrificans]